MIINAYIAKPVDGVSQIVLPGKSGEGIQPIKKMRSLSKNNPTADRNGIRNAAKICLVWLISPRFSIQNREIHFSEFL